MGYRRPSPERTQGDRRGHPASLTRPHEQLIYSEQPRRALSAQGIELVEEELRRRRK
jgi:hypothetical protein